MQRAGQGAYNSSRADEDQMLHVLGIFKGIARGQVAAHAVPHEDHLVESHAFPP